MKLEHKSYDYSKLSGRIREKCGTRAAFSKKIKRSPVHISKVFNNKAYFSQKDIDAGAEVLDILPEEIGVYFFTQEVHENETNTENKKG